MLNRSNIAPSASRKFVFAFLAAVGIVRCDAAGWLDIFSVRAAAAQTQANTASAPETGSLEQKLGCTASIRTDGRADPGAPKPIDILCGKDKVASGGVAAFVLPLNLAAEGKPERYATLDKAVQQSAAGREWAARLNCGDGSWSPSPFGFQSRIANCTQSSGGWPRVTVVAAIGKYLFAGDGLPEALPLIEVTMARMSGAASADKLNAPVDTILAEATARLKAVKPDAKRQDGVIDASGAKAYEALMQKARLHNSAENFVEAERAYRAALQLQERVLGPNAPGIGDTLMHLALEVSNQGRFEEAAGLFRRAEPLVARSPNPGDRARFTTYQAFDATNRHEFEEALQFARDATAMRRSAADKAAGPPGSTELSEAAISARGELAHALMTEGNINFRLGSYSDAEVVLTEAITLLIETPALPPWWRPQAQLLLGETQSFQGRPDAAERNIIGGLRERRRIFGDTLPTASALMTYGRYLSREQQHARAVEAFTEGLDIIGRESKSRGELIFDRIVPFLDSSRALMEADKSQQDELAAGMFRSVQMLDSGVADQTIARAALRFASSDPRVAELVREEQEAVRRRDAAQIELAHETSKPDEQRGRIKEDALEAELKEATALAEKLGRELQQAFPEYANLANPGPLPLEKLRQALASDEAFLWLGFGADAGYGLLVRKEGFSSARIELTEADLAEVVTGLRKAFAVRVGALEAFDMRESYNLYRRIVAPFMPQLADVRHLIVAPGGALASLPMSVLVTEAPKGSDYRTAAWLNRKFAISQVPSARALVSLRAGGHKSAAKRSLLGVGNPTFVGTPKPADGKQDGSGGSVAEAASQCREGPMPPELLRALAPLPETADELTRVARAIGGNDATLLIGARANEGVFRREDLANYRILYFATHGLLPGELSCQSEPALALSPPQQNPQNKDEDGLLDASEIASFKLDADLVVLSACNTAAGGGKFGGGALSGLAESFFHAGARALIASHWQVPSAPTVGLMTGTFERIGSASAKSGSAEALRQSQLTLASSANTAHPYFWAAFTLIGDGGA